MRDVPGGRDTKRYTYTIRGHITRAQINLIKFFIFKDGASFVSHYKLCIEQIVRNRSEYKTRAYLAYNCTPRTHSSVK